MSTRHAALKRECTKLKLNPCNGTIAVLEAKIAKAKAEAMLIEEALNKPSETPSVNNSINIRTSGNRIKDTLRPEERCYQLLSQYDEKLREWAEPIMASEGLEWCRLYAELERIKPGSFDENLSYAISDSHVEDILELLREQPVTRYFTTNYPVFTQILLATPDEFNTGIRGYILANGSDAYINTDDIEASLPYITTTAMAAKLYARYMVDVNRSKRFNVTSQLERSIRDTLGHLSKRGMLLFLAQYEGIRIKQLASHILSSLYDYVVGDDDFIEQILALNKVPDWDILATIAAKRNAPNAFHRVLSSGKISTNKSYLLVEAASHGLVRNIDILLGFPDVDRTNGGSWSALKAAALRGSSEIFDMLEPVDTSSVGIEGFRVAAVIGGNTHILSRTLDYPSIDDDEALIKAVESGNSELVRILLTSSATVVSWAAEAIISLLEKYNDTTGDNSSITITEIDSILMMLFDLKRVPLPLHESVFISYVSSRSVSLLEPLFRGRRFTPDFINSLRTALDDADNIEGYAFVIAATEKTTIPRSKNTV